MKPPIPKQKKEAIAEIMAKPHDWGTGFTGDPAIHPYREGQAARTQTPGTIGMLANQKGRYESQRQRTADLGDMLAESKPTEATAEIWKGATGLSAIADLGLSEPNNVIVSDTSEGQYDHEKMGDVRGAFLPLNRSIADSHIISGSQSVSDTGEEKPGQNLMHEGMHKGLLKLFNDDKYGSLALRLGRTLDNEDGPRAAWTKDDKEHKIIYNVVNSLHSPSYGKDGGKYEIKGKEIENFKEIASVAQNPELRAKIKFGKDGKATMDGMTLVNLSQKEKIALIEMLAQLKLAKDRPGGPR